MVKQRCTISNIPGKRAFNLESPVGNSTNCTAIEGEILVQVTDQNTEPESSNKTNNQRFVNKSSAEIDDIINRNKKHEREYKMGYPSFGR